MSTIQLCEYQCPEVDKTIRVDGYVVDSWLFGMEYDFVSDSTRHKIVFEPLGPGLMEDLDQCFRIGGRAHHSSKSPWKVNKTHIQADTILTPQVFGAERFDGEEIPAGTHVVINFRPEMKVFSESAQVVEVLTLVSVEAFPIDDEMEEEGDSEDCSWDF